MLRIIFVAITFHLFCDGYSRPKAQYEKPLRVEKIYHTVVQTSTSTHTEYSTCTQVPSDIPLCQSLERSREKRSLLTMRKPRFPPRVQAVKSRVILDPSNDVFESSVTEPDALQTTPESVQPIANEIEPELIVFRLTSTLTTLVSTTILNSETTVGITYSGCVPTDAPQVSDCPI